MRIGFIGAGSMGSALARGLGEPAVVHDADEARAEAVVAEVGGRVAASNSELAGQVDLVILCHKPAQLHEVAEEAAPATKAVASIVAATRIAELESAYPGIPVYRFIPNMPVEVGRGVLCYAAGTRAADGPERDVLRLFGRGGVVIALDEPLIEPAMALMSCGPAFIALVVEAMAGAGARHGLDAAQATRLVVETLAGTAAYLDANHLDPAELRGRVATPGGVTEKGLQALEDGGVPQAFAAAVDLVVEATRA
ncbi:MAG: pyrroline-5-carboxylate reductase [Actinomycetota bacterium]|nr:pyrroline-5-carboxylate reductase [Actinomycetota bacterium]